MRRLHPISLVLTVTVICISWKHNIPITARVTEYFPNPADTAAEVKSILQQVVAWNSQQNATPPANFKKGHITRRSLKNYLTKTSYGYVIKMPSNTNIPTPTIYNNTLYAGAGFGSKEYYAFDAATGNFRWGAGLDDDGPSAAAVEDSIMVFNTESCTIFACDAITGTHKWSYWLGDPLMSMPTISNGIVFTSYPASYAGTLSTTNDSTPALRPSHILIAIALKTGKILWQKWIDSDIMSAPVAKNDLLYFSTFSGGIYTVKPKTGEILEAKAARATSAPVFGSHHDMIYSHRSDISGRDSVASEAMVYAYSAGNLAKAGSARRIANKKAVYLDGRVQNATKLKFASTTADAGNGFAGGAPATANWQAGFFNIGQGNVSSLQSFQGSRALYHNGFIFNTPGDEVVCTDTSGKVIWKHQLTANLKEEGGFAGTPPIYAGECIIVATLKGEVLVFNAEAGKLVQSFQLGDPVRYQPVAHNGWIYVTAENGKLHAINTGNTAITGWNMWGCNAARTNSIEQH